MLTSMKQLDIISKNTVEQTQTVSASIKEEAAANQEIAASSQTIAKMADNLQNAIHKFKL